MHERHVERHPSEARSDSVRLETLPLRHPAFVFAALVAAACIVLFASYRLYDTDLWQHLGIGKAIWTLREIPATSQWSWRQLGEPQVVSSWLFRVVLWPVWSTGGIEGLFLFRWVATLVTFGAIWAAARAMGARGLTALLVLVWCGAVYRLRTELRAEILAALLFALELWILERRRQSGAARAEQRREPAASADSKSVGWGSRIDPVWALVPIAWAWANIHVSYWVGLMVLGFYLLDGLLARRRTFVPTAAARRHRGRRERPAEPARARPPARTHDALPMVAATAIAVSFIHPSGWRALWQPFEFLIYWRNDPLFRTIGEFHPLPWRLHLRSGLPLLLLVWPVLAIARWRSRGPDVVELLCYAFFAYAAISSQRFASLYALVAAPFVARDLSERVSGWRLPRVLAGPWPRAALASLAMVGISLPELTRPDLPLGVGIEPNSVPAGACDFMARHDVGGRGFNELHLGGYQLYRFWPDARRLPFIHTQPEYTSPEERGLYVGSHTDPDAWRELDRRCQFDYALVDRHQSPGSRLLDILDQDDRWTLVFMDDAAELLVRTDGPLRSLAQREGFQVLPASPAARRELIGACASDPSLRAAAKRDVGRAIGSSPRNGTAHQLMGMLLMMEERLDEARSHLESALLLQPSLPRVHELLGRIALAQGRAQDAVLEFRRERNLHGVTLGLDLLLGKAYAGSGDTGRARQAYRRELDRFPSNTEAQDSLAASTAR